MKRKTWCLAVGMLGFVWMLGGCAQQSSEAAEEPEPVQEETVSEENTEEISDSEEVNIQPEGDLIAQNISFTIPDGLNIDPYDPDVGYGGGCLLLPEAYEKYDKDATPPEWAASGSIFRFSTDMITWDGDTIKKVDVYWNHTCEENIGSVSGMAAPAYMMKMQHDLYTPAGLSALEERGEEIPEDIQSEYWYVFMANPEDEIGYAVSLNTKNFGEEDILEFAESIQYK